jgi:hypothetical protein
LTLPAKTGSIEMVFLYYVDPRPGVG